jgi:hypothetical protein
MKNFNFKALLVNHGEKIVFGLFATLVLAVLAVGTSWGRYEKTPDQLKQSVANARSKITAADNFWPKAKEESFKIVDFSDKASLLFAPLSMARYDFTTPLNHPLYRKDEPKRESIYEPIQLLIAKAGLAPLSISTNDGRSQPEDSETAPAEMETSGEGGEFDQRPGGGGGPGNMGVGGGPLTAGTPALAAGGAGGPMGASGPSAARGRPPAGQGGPAGLGRGALMMPPGMMTGAEGMGAGGGMSSQNSGVTSRGVRFVAVRGVFPLKKQIENYKRALHISDPEAAELVEITDFVLERQTAMAGSEPWKDGKWETVNISSALEVLQECSDIDSLDPVPTALRDAVITMDLPLRLIGVWADYATHPQIKMYELNREAIDEENKLLEKLDDTISNSAVGDTPQPRQRGLAVAQRDVKRMASQVMSNGNMMNAMMKGPGAAHGGPAMPGMPPMGPMSGMPGGMPANMRGAAAEISRLVGVRPYLLFRYFDFDVQSGMAYRYRVRLKLRNPNFERSPDELAGADAEIAKGEERETPWSNISNPDIVPTTVNYFLKDVEREPYHEEKVKTTTRPVALLSMFDWDTKLGTVINEVLNLTSIGGFVGEVKKNTMVLDLAEGTLSKVDHTFATQDVLIDVESDIDVDPGQHLDLKLPVDKARGITRLGLLEEALVFTSLGELKTLDPVGDKSRENYWKHRSEEERKHYKEGTTPKDTSRLSPMMTGMGGPQPDEGNQTTRKRSPRKRSRRGGASAMGGMSGGMGAMPGMGGMGGMPPGMGGMPAGGAHGGSKGKKK